MTLAQIGKVLGESEATASRQLARTRRTIREEVERRLRDEERMSESEISEGFAAVVKDSATLDLAEVLGVAQETDAGSFKVGRGTIGGPRSTRSGD